MADPNNPFPAGMGKSTPASTVNPTTGNPFPASMSNAPAARLDAKATRALLTGTESLDNILKKLNLEGRASSKIDRANKIARLDAQDQMWFGDKTNTSESMATQVDKLKELQETIDEFKADGMKPKVLEKMYDKNKKAITKEGKQIFRKVGKAIEYHQGAMEALDKESLKVQSDLFKDFEKELKKIQEIEKGASEESLKALKEKVDVLRERHSTIKDAVKDHFEGLKERHVDAISEIKNVVTEIETATGLSAAEHMGVKPLAVVGSEAAKASKGVMTEVEFEGKSFTGKQAAKINANWKSGGLGAVQVGIGAIGLADAARRVFSGVSNMMSNDPEKKDENGVSQLVTGLAEGTIAVLIAGAGGKAKATGMAV